MPDRTCVLRTVRASRRAVSAAGGAVAAHRAPNSAVLSIEGARTYAHAISTGAVAVFRAFQRAQPGVDRSRRARGASAEAASRRCDPHPNLSFVCRIHIADGYVTYNCALRLTVCRRLAHLAFTFQ